MAEPLLSLNRLAAGSQAAYRAVVLATGGKPLGHLEPLLDLAQDHHAAIGRQLAAVKTGDNFFALDR